MKSIATDYYADLLNTKITHSSTARKLLKNTKNKISLQQRVNSEKYIAMEELDKPPSNYRRTRLLDMLVFQLSFVKITGLSSETFNSIS